MNPKKVLILIDRLGRGGVAQVVMNVALSLNRDKYEPIICTTRDKPRNGQDQLLHDAGIQLIELNRQSRLQILSWKPLLQQLPDVSILHTHSSGSNFWGRVLGSLNRVPVIVTQEHAAVTEKTKVMRWLDRGLAPLSTKIITVSKYDQLQYTQLEKLPPDKVETIYVGINMKKFSAQISKSEARDQLGLSNDKWLIGMVARLAPQKNHKGLFDALTLLPEELRAKMHCLLVGSGDLIEELTQDVQRLGLTDQVSFLGERDDIPVILRALDLLVLPSYWECLPSVLSEAMSAECPIVATEVGGVPEMIEEVGWPLVPPNDVPSLAAGITEIWEMSPAERDRRVELGYKHVQTHFNRDVSVAHLERLYDTLLQNKAARPSIAF